MTLQNTHGVSMNAKISGTEYAAFHAALYDVIQGAKSNSPINAKINPNGLEFLANISGLAAEQLKYYSDGSSRYMASPAADHIPQASLRKVVKAVADLGVTSMSAYEAAKRSCNHHISSFFMCKWMGEIEDKLDRELHLYTTGMTHFSHLETFLAGIASEYDFEHIRNKSQVVRDFDYYMYFNDSRRKYIEKDSRFSKNTYLLINEIFFRVLNDFSIPPFAFQFVTSNEFLHWKSEPVIKFMDQKYCSLMLNLDLTGTTVKCDRLKICLDRMPNLLKLSVKGCRELKEEAFKDLRHEKIIDIDISSTLVEESYITNQNFPSLVNVTLLKLVKFNFINASLLRWEEIEQGLQADIFENEDEMYKLSDKLKAEPTPLALSVLRVLRKKFKSDRLIISPRHARALVECLRVNSQKEIISDHIIESLSSETEPEEFRMDLEHEWIPFISLTAQAVNTIDYYRESRKYKLSPHIQNSNHLSAVKQALTRLRVHNKKPFCLYRAAVMTKERLYEIYELAKEVSGIVNSLVLPANQLIGNLVELSYHTNCLTYEDAFWKILYSNHNSPNSSQKLSIDMITKSAIHALFAYNLSYASYLNTLKLILNNLHMYNTPLLAKILSGTLTPGDLSESTLMDERLLAFKGILYETRPVEPNFVVQSVLELKKTYLLALNLSNQLVLTKEIIDSIAIFYHQSNDSELNEIILEILGTMGRDFIARPLTLAPYNPNISLELCRYAKEVFRSLRS